MGYLASSEKLKIILERIFVKSLAASLLVLALGPTAMATSNKVCFGSTKNYETKGVIILAQIDRQQITLKTIKGEFYSAGRTYPAYNSSSKGRDGKVYLHYKGEYTDYQERIMVDQDLLNSSTTGLLQIRARGEGFFNSVFVCRDANKN